MAWKQDIISDAEWESTMAEIKAQFGRLDCVVNNAGMVIFKPIAEFTLEDYDMQILINMTRVILLAAAIGWFALALPARADTPVQTVLETTLGDIVIEVYPDRAPISAGSFLRFIDAGRLDGGGFYRVVRSDNDNGSPVISVIQGGVLGGIDSDPADAVAHETTEQTGILHQDGVVSLGRTDPGTASGGSFFICIGDQPGLDLGGTRNPDQLGFATFGRVVSGMSIVRAINQITETAPVDDPYLANQMLAQPVLFSRAYRQQEGSR